jgi:hypothetical protein
MVKRPSLTYVDSTILLALIGSGPCSDAVRRWFCHTAAAWVSSEIALARALKKLDGHQAQRGARSLSLAPLLQALHAGIAIRPLPLAVLASPAKDARLLNNHQQAGQATLSWLDALELASACHWRCPCLISNHAGLQRAAKAAGLQSFGVGLTTNSGRHPSTDPAAPASATTPTAAPAIANTPPTATVGDWPRRSPIQP